MTKRYAKYYQYRFDERIILSIQFTKYNTNTNHIDNIVYKIQKFIKEQFVTHRIIFPDTRDY